MRPDTRKIPDHLTRLMFIAMTSALVAVSWGCSSSQDRIRYSAEKKLYKAEKLRSEWARSLRRDNRRFADRAIEEYRAIVEEFGDKTNVEGVAATVFAAQMSLAHLEVQLGRFAAALRDFEKGLELDGGPSEARMTALFAAAELSEGVRDYDRAATLYGRFYADYLSGDGAIGSIQPSHLAAPLRLSRIVRETGDQQVAALWLQRAEELYTLLEKNSSDTSLVKASEFNLLTTYIERRKWDAALKQLDKLEEKYPAPPDQAGLRFLRARVYEIGFDDRAKASNLYRSIYEDFPRSTEAPKAMLLDAALTLKRGKIGEASAIYKRVLGDYGNHGDAAVEAEWELASIEEATGDWPRASLRYRKIASEYPATHYGFESPLRVASRFEGGGEKEAANRAYEQALKGYERIVAGDYGVMTKLMAEDYILQVFVRQERWRDAIDHLRALLGKYPDYMAVLQGNYVTASIIYEDRLGDRQAAIEMLHACIEMNPDSHTATVARERLGRMTAAR